MPTFENVTEQWNLSKPAVTGRNGIVATNHYEVSEIGADVLRRGGNAVDAAFAVSFAILSYRVLTVDCTPWVRQKHRANKKYGVTVADTHCWRPR